MQAVRQPDKCSRHRGSPRQVGAWRRTQEARAGGAGGQRVQATARTFRARTPDSHSARTSAPPSRPQPRPDACRTLPQPAPRARRSRIGPGLRSRRGLGGLEILRSSRSFGLPPPPGRRTAAVPGHCCARLEAHEATRPEATTGGGHRGVRKYMLRNSVGCIVAGGPIHGESGLAPIYVMLPYHAVKEYCCLCCQRSVCLLHAEPHWCDSQVSPSMTWVIKTVESQKVLATQTRTCFSDLFPVLLCCV